MIFTILRRIVDVTHVLLKKCELILYKPGIIQYKIVNTIFKHGYHNI